MIFSKLKLSHKLPLIIVTLAAISAVTVGLLSIKTSSDAAVSEAKVKLSSLNSAKINLLENYFV